VRCSGNLNTRVVSCQDTNSDRGLGSHNKSDCLFPIITKKYKGRNISVSIALVYGLDDWSSMVRFPGGLGIFLLTTAVSRWLWGPPSLLSNGYQGLFPSG
jgi:hypothetical protein